MAATGLIGQEAVYTTEVKTNGGVCAAHGGGFTGEKENGEKRADLILLVL